MDTTKEDPVRASDGDTIISARRVHIQTEPCNRRQGCNEEGEPETNMEKKEIRRRTCARVNKPLMVIVFVSMYTDIISCKGLIVTTPKKFSLR